MKAGAAGGIEAVVKTINRHINNVSVSYRGCSALCNMTADNGKTSDKVKQQNIKS